MSPEYWISIPLPLRVSSWKTTARMVSSPFIPAFTDPPSYDSTRVPHPPTASPPTVAVQRRSDPPTLSEIVSFGTPFLAGIGTSKPDRRNIISSALSVLKEPLSISNPTGRSPIPCCRAAGEEQGYHRPRNP